MDDVRITVDSAPDGVTLEFSLPIKKIKLGTQDARLFGESILAKVAEAEKAAVDTNNAQWLKAPLDLESTTWLKTLASTIVEMETHGAIPAAYGPAIANVRLLVNEPEMIDQLDAYVSQMFDANTVRKVIARDETEAKKMIAFLDWIAALPTVPPPS